MAMVTGCAEGLVVPRDHDATGQPADELDTGEVPATSPRLLPKVCDFHQWTTVNPDAKDMDLAVVPIHRGAAVFGVARTGGTVRGFLVDPRGNIVGDPLGTKIHSDATFTGVTAGIADGLLVTGLINSKGVSITLLSEDLRDYREVGQLEGNLVTETPVMHARGERITATGGWSGMLASRFDDAWSPTGTQMIARSLPTSMTGAAYGDDVMIAWSTGSDCNLERVASGVTSHRPGACEHPRLATNWYNHEAALVYEDGDRLMITNIKTDLQATSLGRPNELNVTRVLRPNATAPRIAFDGKRYWVGYLDVHGDLVVGYVDETTGTLVSMALDGTTPQAEAYDLAVINGSVWVFAADSSGYGAHELCLAPE